MQELLQLEGVARLFEVLSDKNRLVILQCLKDQPYAVGELVERSKLSQPMVSKHLATLYEAGLLNRARRKVNVIYSIKEPLVFQLCDLVCEKLFQDAQNQLQIFGRGAAS